MRLHGRQRVCMTFGKTDLRAPASTLRRALKNPDPPSEGLADRERSAKPSGFSGNMPPPMRNRTKLPPQWSRSDRFDAGFRSGMAPLAGR
jgi:hypothetical protein